jgi:arylsulfatase A-like enzyme
LEVLEIRIYGASNSTQDDHSDEQALSSIPVGTPSVLSSLVRNDDYSSEHFDLITEVFDSNGVVVYLDVRYDVSVPLGSQVTIDASVPVSFTELGKYAVKIFTWSDVDGDPLPLSFGSERSADVTSEINIDIPPDVPNIVVIMADDLDQRSLDILLQEGMMPNLKRHIVDEGVTFSNSFATYPLCCPSRATFLTGQYPHNHNVWNNNLPLGGVTKLNDSSTVATWLDDSGYYTAYVGKYLNRYGQDTAETYIPPGWDEWQATVGRTTYWMYSYTVNDNGRLIDYGDAESDYQTDVLAARSVQVINEADIIDSTPFFLYINPLAPHNDGTTDECALNYGTVGSTIPPPRYAGATADIPFPRPPSFNEEDISDKPRTLQYPTLDSTHIECFENLFHARLETLLAVDDLIGEVVSALSRSNELSHTVIVFVSDNGFMLGEHRLHGKQYVYEESIRTPIIIRAPGITPKTIDSLVTNNDFAPTFLQFAEAEADIPVDGRSLVPLMMDPDIQWRTAFLIEDNLYSAVRTENYVYSHNHNSGAQEVYDLQNDLYQLQNLEGTASWDSKMEALDEWREALAECSGLECHDLEDRVPP